MDHEGVPWESRAEAVEGLGGAHLLNNPPIAVEVNEGAVEVEHHHYLRHLLLLQQAPPPFAPATDRGGRLLGTRLVGSEAGQLRKRNILCFSGLGRAGHSLTLHVLTILQNK